MNLHVVNMGSKSSKPKFNKDGEKQKMCKIGLSVGRNDLKLEGNFQVGYHSKIDKKYTTVDGKCITQRSLTTIHEEEGEEEEA